MKLLIGCPVSDREWIIQKWKEHVDTACSYLSLRPEFVFVAASSDPSVEILSEWGTVIAADESRRSDVRDWDTERYRHMVTVRNTLLREVRLQQPDLFLSLDSDILLQENALASVIEVLETKRASAVGGKLYMGRGTRYPSYGDNFGLKRPDCVAVKPVAVIMAMKLMAPEAYQIDYEFHPHGEDVGWSKAVGRNGGHLWWDGRVTNKHVMSPEMLGRVDDRVGF